jgi:hypothetical protein
MTITGAIACNCCISSSVESRMSRSMQAVCLGMLAAIMDCSEDGTVYALLACTSVTLQRRLVAKNHASKSIR